MRQFVNDPRKRWSGTELTKTTKIGSGTLYPLLAKLESAGWLSAEWEVLDPSEAGRPRRRYYKLTALGVRSAHGALSEYQVAPGLGEVAWTT
ncbi:PadR family transcriptional regulator [Rhodopseudomonas sp. BR0G17]|nr:PadR family transcriptional regulator [Rhodopseudomonas sp. BR0G17]